MSRTESRGWAAQEALAAARRANRHRSAVRASTRRVRKQARP